MMSTCEEQGHLQEGNPRVDIEDIPDDVKLKWDSEQSDLKKKLKLEDHEVIREMQSAFGADADCNADKEFYIAGVDISFVKGDSENACAALIVVSLPDLEVKYEDYEMVKLTEPYIPGYLAFREAPHIVQLFNKLMQTNPQYKPQVLMLDGNGILHPKEFGLACHIGVELDIPSLGVAKKLFQVDGLEKDEEHQKKVLEHLKKGGDTFPLVGQSGRVLGKALRSCDKSTNPVYVSPGHMISVDSAVWMAHRCCKFRIPEPVRLADINSREFLRVNFKKEAEDGSAD